MASSSHNLVLNSIIKSLVLILLTLMAAVILGITVGMLNNMDNIEKLLEDKRPALPSKLLDRNGELITEFYSDEKRDLITIDQVPDYLIKGLILWEDESFYHHKGFNVLAIMRATLNNALGKPVSGASTLTQQLSRTIFLSNRFSWSRKFRELWIAIQLEKKYTKNEILTLYLNHVPLGAGTNGVGAAARYYFDKPIEEIDYAEASSLITIISNPTFYSFIRFPKNHKTKQKEVLRKMTKSGILTDVESQESFNNFWLKWQTSSHTSRGAFYNREDKAPFFSDWVMNEINNELPNVNIFRDGLVIHSTLDVRWNQLAEQLYEKVLDKQQKYFEEEQVKTYNIIQDYFIDTVGLLADTFSLTNINVNRNINIKRGLTEYNKDINPSLNLMAQTLGLNFLETLTENYFNKEENAKKMLSPVQGAFIVLENDTGQIITMIGGKKFDPNNRFNYAMQSQRQPGSAFKPFVYSAAFDTKMFSPFSIMIDKPHVFTFDSEDPDDWYIPSNYGARYYGKVNIRKALRKSLNIPACKIFYAIGKNNDYKVPIDRAALLIGLNSQSEIDKRFKTEISTVLGTGSVSPVEMAAAYSVFANNGKRRIVNSILYVEDRDGKVIYNPWKELQKYYRENDKKLQIISPSNAYMMTSVLKETINMPDGTLANVKKRILEADKEFPPVELAGKTGTTQNWSDAWVIGYSPKITAAGWVGFNKYGLSLGYEQSGASVVGPTWMEYMRLYHQNKGSLSFEKPDQLKLVKVCKQSGLLPSEYCEEEDLYFDFFLAGTYPKAECNYCEENIVRREKNIDSISTIFEKSYDKTYFGDIFEDDELDIDQSLLNEFDADSDDLTIDDTLLDLDLFDDDEISIDDYSDMDIDVIGDSNDNEETETEPESINETEIKEDPTADEDTGRFFKRFKNNKNDQTDDSKTTTVIKKEEKETESIETASETVDETLSSVDIAGIDTTSDLNTENQSELIEN